MADRPFDTPLPADLPEDWTSGQIVAPVGADVGLSQQHGYNYLMEQVNAAQRAANAINESFDTISGKRTCRVTVGASAAGWAQADCDYLCDGTDDQEEFNAAIAAVQAAGGGEIALLAGEYNISEEWEVNTDAAPLTLSGEPGAAVLNMAANITFSGPRAELDRAPVRFQGISLHGAGGLFSAIFAEVPVTFEACRFLDIVPTIVQYVVSLTYDFQFKGNSVEHSVNDPSGRSEMLSVTLHGDSRFMISGNVFKYAVSLPENTPSGRMISVLSPRGTGGAGTAGGIVADNVITCDSGVGDVGIYVRGGGCVANNCVSGADIEVAVDVTCVGNRVEDGGIKAAESCTVAGNQVTGGNIVAGEYTPVTGNCVAAPSNLPAVLLRKAGGNSNPEKETAIVVGNIITAGSIGVHLTNEGMIGTNKSQTNALVSSNRITGCTTSIQIESNWSGCLVTGNMIDSAVVDSGVGNLVRLNSDDDGGGGGGTAGVTSFNGRSGAVAPLEGDYTASMVGARPDSWTPSAADVGAIPSGAVQSIQAMTQAEYDALAAKSDITLYLIKE